MRAIIAITVAAALGGCGPRPAVTARPDRPARGEPAPQPPVDPSTIPLAELGFPEAPEPPPEAAVEANAVAVGLHEAGDDYRARTGYREILEAAPGYDEARYNLARVLVALGELDEAASEVRTLVRRDLAEFGPRFETERDLEALRRADQGRALLAEIEALYTIWGRAVAEGQPAVLYWPRPDDALPRETQIAPALLRPGLYLRAERRLLAATPVVDGASAALVFPGVSRAAVIVAGIYDSQLFDVTASWETGKELLLFDLPFRGVHPLTRRFPERLAGLSVQATERGARFRRHLLLIDEGSWDVEDGPFELLTMAGGREDPDQGPFEGAVLYSGAPDGATSLPAPSADLRVTAAGLAGSGEPIPLGPGLDGEVFVVPDRGGRRAAVLAAVAPCDSRDETAHAAVELVDLDARRTVRLAEGQGRAMVTFDGVGALYLQVDRPEGSALLVVPPGAEAAEAAPAGVLLRAPIPPEADCSP